MKLIISAGLLFCASTLCAAAPQTAGATLIVPDVPAALAVQPNQVLKLIANANGVQIYTCGPNKEDPARFEWQFKAPEAELSDERGAPLGKHYGGPTWESNDGSKVIGQVKANLKSPDASAVSWLLLGTKSNQGSGVFGHTGAVQRLHTIGGVAPAEGCDLSHQGNELRVPYTAQYYFYD